MTVLLNDDLGAWGGLAGETAGADLLERDHAILGGVNGEVAAHERTFAGNLRATGLANQDFAFRNLLATEAFDAQAGTGVVVDVL